MISTIFPRISHFKKAGLLVSFTGIDVEPEYIWKTMNALKELEEVLAHYLTSSDHTILAEILAGSFEELNKIHDRLNDVKRICPSIVLEVVM